jgi:hypothetical protein
MREKGDGSKTYNSGLIALRVIPAAFGSLLSGEIA